MWLGYSSRVIYFWGTFTNSHFHWHLDSLFSSPAFVSSCLFGGSHSNRLHVMSHCGCDLHLLSDVEHFLYTCWPFEYPLWKNVYSDPLPILKLDYYYYYYLLLSCMSSFHILHINPLSTIWFANTLFDSIGAFSFHCLFLVLCRDVFGWCGQKDRS